MNSDTQVAIPTRRTRRIAHYGSRVIVEGAIGVWRPLNVVLGPGLLAAVLVLVGFMAGLSKIGWAWFLAALFAEFSVIAALGGYRVWNTVARQSEAREAELSRIRVQEVHTEHRDQLRDRLRSVFNEMWSGQPVGHGDGFDGDDRNERIFFAHFPDLAEPLREWNAVVERNAAARPSLRDAAEAEAERLDIASSFDCLPALLDQLMDVVADRALAGALGKPINLRWGCTDYRTAIGPRPGPGKEFEVHFLGRAGQPLAHLPAEPEWTSESRIRRVYKQGEELFRAMEKLAEAQEIVEARDALETFKLSLRDQIWALQAVSVIRVRETCPTCRANLNLD